MNNKKMLGNLLLLLTAMIWGTAFVFQRVGMDSIEPITFNAARMALAAVMVGALAFGLRQRHSKGVPRQSDAGASAPGTEVNVTRQAEESDLPWSHTWKGGICCGLFLTAGSVFQQMGVVYTTAGKAGFITAMYIVLVPLVGIFLKRKAGWKIWVSVALSVVGLYLLSMKPGDFTLGMGDLYVLLAAAAFAFQITAVDYYAARVDNLWLACMEFLVCGLITLVFMLLFEHPTLSGILAAKWPILYAGVLSCGVAYTFQILGQRRTDPAVASLIMSLESSISVISGWLFLGQEMSERELLGCLFMFAAIVIAQLPAPSRVIRNRRNNTGQC